MVFKPICTFKPVRLLHTEFQQSNLKVKQRFEYYRFIMQDDKGLFRSQNTLIPLLCHILGTELPPYLTLVHEVVQYCR